MTKEERECIKQELRRGRWTVADARKLLDDNEWLEKDFEDCCNRLADTAVERDELRQQLTDATGQIDLLLGTIHAGTVMEEKLRAQLAEYEARWSHVHTCVHCGASLWLRDEPPHCWDCVVTEDERDDWIEENDANVIRGGG